MVQLIPLKLQPISRPDNHPQLTPSPNRPPPLPAKSPRRMESKMPSALPLPQTKSQWRIVLDEVRATYLRRQYRQCSVRCIQLLDGAPNMVLPLNCIYLSFYAAICLELLARSMSINCSDKLPLFKLARVYYQKTEQYMWEAESEHFIANSEVVGRSSLENRRCFPSSSSYSSTSSRSSTVTSAPNSPNAYSSISPLHSPASSVCSSFTKSEDESCDTFRPQPLRVKKTVSFHQRSSKPHSAAECDYSSSSPRASSAFQLGPFKCSSPTTECYSTTVRPANTISSASASPLVSNSIASCDNHLATFRTQLKHHLSIITDLIQSIQNSLLSSSSTMPNHTEYGSTRSNLPSMLDSYETPLLHVTEPETAEVRARQRAARIAQLKQRGEDWKSGRSRFDGSRYERLCEEALRDLQS